MGDKRTRKVGSIKNELLQKSRESMLTAVQIYNNPNIQFKSESFIVLIVISWTYLLHAYYRDKKIEYRYFSKTKTRKKFDKTRKGAYKYWELERCLQDKKCPIDKVTISNLMFLIGLRHEIEHQMTTRIDSLLSARFQACCLNYNNYLKKLFSGQDGIEKYLSFSLQFTSISEEQLDLIKDHKDLPQNISTYVEEFDQNLTESDFNDVKYSYRVILIPKTTNRIGQADRVIEFVNPESEMAKGISKEYWSFKDREKPKYLPSKICQEMQKLGYKNFKQHQHIKLWKSIDAKNPEKNFGIQIENTRYWYDNWFEYVKKHCLKHRADYI
jgi:hypothetical protein